jgi:glycine cleavage system H lipoate-binding protein
VTAWFSEELDLALVSKEYLRGLQPGDGRLTVLGREVYIPVMNPENPCLERIGETGMAPVEFARAFTPGEPLTWGNIAGNECREIVNAYRINDDSFLSYLAEFTGKDPGEIGGHIKGECKLVMEAVREDRLALGFCTLAQLMDLQRTGDSLGVVMIPVDKNQNNSVDHFEKIYNDVDALARGVWIGKYPATLFSKIYAVSKNGNQPGDALTFLHWMVTDGQKVMAANGFSGLLENEQETILANLYAGDASMIPGGEESRANMLPLILVGLAGIILLGFIVFGLVKGKVIYDRDPDAYVVTKESPDIEYAPGGYFIDKSHTWVYMEKNGDLRIGIDKFLQYITGEISRVGIKAKGEKVNKGEVLLTLVQHGKTLEVRSPASGVISGTNDALLKKGASVKDDPYNAGWICMIEPSNWEGELSSYTRGSAYAKWIKDEIARVKDFIAEKLERMLHHQAQPVLQEGGELRAGLMEDLGPEAWEEFQSGFLHR